MFGSGALAHPIHGAGCDVTFWAPRRSRHLRLTLGLPRSLVTCDELGSCPLKFRFKSVHIGSG